MPIPQEILKLVERFESQRDAYQSGKYNEAQIRAEFIDPLFKALGWDIHNEQGYAEAYKDVIHEDAIKIGGATEAPDLCFRIGGARKFFVECKKPSVNIKDDVHPAYQLRRYAWSARLPLSILTDFHELAVYDCRAKPDKNDSSAIARLMYFTSNQFVEKWDEFYAIFSRAAVLKGSFDKYAESTKGRKGTASVDDAFLEEIERWRDMLARNIAMRNEKLSQRELNFAVQRIIDRIIFLRICEDRGVEPYGRLMTLRNGERAYPRLGEFFRRADERYNSGLFHFQREKDRPEAPDELTLNLKIDDKILKDIIGNLYYPESPYEFSVLPADILGHVYERFLGKVIRLTAGHQAKVEDKPEVRKAGGVYYTPTYIVDYIVKNTVGKLLESKTPKQAARLKILDPACGSGSFLLGAYQYLLNWHRDYYVMVGSDQTASDGRAPGSGLKRKKSEIGNLKSKIYQAGGDYRLTTDEKKRILLNNIYGVDIDSQAVEVTKLSLLLKVLEGESQETITKQFELFHQRALPDLGSNIKCGNSLIGPDFYKDRQGELFGEDEMFRINAFDWQAEFSEIMKNGGFDAVIGNPPYGAEFTDEELTYLRKQMGIAAQSLDSYELFMSRGADLLTQGGRLSMIIPASWMTGNKYERSRRKLVTGYTPLVAYALPFNVFKAAYIDTAIVVFKAGGGPPSALIHYFPKKPKLTVVPDGIGTNVPIRDIRTDSQCRLTVLLSADAAPVMRRFAAVSTKFGDCFTIQRGVQPYSRALHTEEQIARRFLHATFKKSQDHLPELQGNELSRYYIAPKRQSYLKYCDDIASRRPVRMFQGKRIVLRRLLTRKFRLQASAAVDTMITTDNVLNIVPSGEVNVEYALGLLNSKLLSWMYVNASMIAQKDDFPQVHISALAALPIPKASERQTANMVELIETMLKLHQDLTKANTPHDKETLQRQISATDREIDRLVYELYGLTEEEIRIVEENAIQ